ncbi:uncharacterized protein ACRADG_002056 [Cochliomyia hominivorax]
MFKFAVVIFALIACAAAKPGLVAPLAYTAPVAAPVVAAPAPVVTATSSQFVARNHNDIAAAPIVAPVAAPVIAKTIAAPVVAPAAYAAAPLAYSAPLAYAAPAPFQLKNYQKQFFSCLVNTKTQKNLSKMFKFAVVIFAVIACAAAKPGLVAPLAYTAPAAVVAAPAPVVTATSSQVIARNHNGIATAPIVAPVAAPVVAKAVAAPVALAAPVARYAAAYTAPLAYSAPVVAKYAAAASLAYTAPVVAKYTAAAPLAYSAPLTYAAAPALW